MRAAAGCLVGLLLAPAVFATALRRGAAAPERLLAVYAAASLMPAFNALKPEFQKSQPGQAVRFNYGASSSLRTQIEQGAPAEVFASADHAQMQPLVASHLVLPPHTFARNRLVVVVPAGNPGKIRTLRDLTRPGLRLVATAETVPIGRYTRQVLEKLSRMLGADFARRFEANVISRELDVRSVLSAVELGEADAAMVYETDARSSRRVRSLPIPDRANVRAEYPIAVVAGSRNRAGAEAFVRFVLSAGGQRVLRRYGFR